MLYAESEKDVSENYDVLDIVSNGRNLKGRSGGKSGSGGGSGGGKSRGGTSGGGSSSGSSGGGGTSRKTRVSVRTFLYGTSLNKDSIDGKYDDDEECEETVYEDGTIEVECGSDPTVAIVIGAVVGTIILICIGYCLCKKYRCKDRCKNCCKNKGGKKVSDKHTGNDAATNASSQ